ncbi:GDSL-type esterase/lipase family protein [Erythrobacter sp. NE805]|uniref:GDSL-type esterase/lipase family protein n=1 Tax=Erythrobacter sp. NE805 TaxID=3389875 RepID=UPI00396B23C6
MTFGMLLRGMAPILLAAALFGGPVGAAPAIVPVGPDALVAFDTPVPLRLGGRVRAEAEGFTSAWPGTYVEARFVGTQVLVGPFAGRSRWRVFVDGADLGLIDARIGPVFVVGGLAAGEHLLRLERIDEDRYANVQLLGVSVPRDARVLPPGPGRPDQIEFIGDSFMTGFGLSAGKAACTDEEVWETTDTSRAWPVLVAKALGADYAVNAYSGAGLVRNFVYQAGKPTMQKLYLRTLPETVEPWRRPATWRPRTIIVALGENDLSEPFLPREALADSDTVTRALAPALARFARGLRKANPGARILLLDYGYGPVREAHAAAYARLSARDRAAVRLVTMERDFALSGCFAHLDAADNRRVAARVLAALGANRASPDRGGEGTTGVLVPAAGIEPAAP